ncbi:MAG: hypothetical protein ABL895_01990 [Cyclobacteriaceae bacterium]
MSKLQHYLETDLGIHKNAIEFLCTRQAPENNEYWKGRKDFISQSPGYLFIPILFDLFLKSNLGAAVLTELHLLLIEEILHSAARQESGSITYLQHHQECREILYRNGTSIEEITRVERLVSRPFTHFPANYKSLRRANSYLYSAVLFPNNYNLIFNHWESVMPLFLFLDDLTDLPEDLVTHSENSLLDSPNLENNFFTLHSLIAESIKPVEKINDVLYKELNRMRQEAVASTLGGILFGNNR